MILETSVSFQFKQTSQTCLLPCDLFEGVDVVGGVVEGVVGLQQHEEVADVETDVEQSQQQEVVKPFQLGQLHLILTLNLFYCRY